MEFWRVGGLALALMLPAVAFGQSVSDKIDRFTGKREISYLKSVGSDVKFGVPIPGFFVTKGEKEISGIRFMISPEPGRYAAQSAQFIGCKNVDWLIDGRPVRLGLVVHDLRRFDRLLVEFVVQEASVEQIGEIGAAREVEFRICGKEGRLDNQDIAAAREVASLASGNTSPSTPPLGNPSEPKSQGAESTKGSPQSAWRKWGQQGQ